MSVPITALYGSLNAVFNIVLGIAVSQGRVAHKVSLGTGDNAALLLRNRIHANNAEYVPLGVVVLLIAELSGGTSMVLHCLGGALLVGRVFHAYGMTLPRTPNFFRGTGIALTWLMILGAAIYALVLRGF